MLTVNDRNVAILRTEVFIDPERVLLRLELYQITDLNHNPF